MPQILKKSKTKAFEFFRDDRVDEGEELDLDHDHDDKINQEDHKGNSLLRSGMIGLSSTFKQEEENSDDEKQKLQANEDEAQDDELEEGQMQSVGGTDHTQNMKNFITNYGVELNIPSYYIVDAKVYPKDPSLCLQVLQYAMSKHESKQEYIIRTFSKNDDGEIQMEQKNLNDVYNPERFCCNQIRLVKSEHGYQKVLKEVKIRGSKKLAISFSPDGEKLALFMKKVNNLYIFQIGDDLMEFLDKIKQNPDDEDILLNGVEQEPILKNSKQLQFDSTGNYLTVYGFEKLAIIDVNDKENPVMEDYKYEIDKEKYSLIMGAQFFYDEEIMRVDDIACQALEQKKVCIFTLGSQSENQRVILYQHDSQNSYLKISRDCTKVVFSNLTESYILEEDSSQWNSKSYSQTSLSSIKNQQIMSIVQAGLSDFLFICCKPYDRDLDIVSSKDETFKLGIKRQIEPDSLKVLDAFQQDVEEGQIYGQQMSIASTLDGDFYLDTVSPINQYQNRGSSILDQSVDYETQGFAANWPYVTFKGLENNMFVIDSNKRTINRVLLPDEYIRVKCSYITDTMDIFFILELEHGYEVFRINLDNYEDQDRSKQRFELQQLFSFSKEKVENKKLLDFHVRASSEKSKINLNKKTVVLMLFEGQLYTWTDGVNSKDDDLTELHQTISITIQRQDDDSIIIGKIDDGKKKVFQLIQVTIEFTSCISECIYFESQELDVVQTFAYDFSANILLLMKRDAQRKKKKAAKTLEIIDLGDENKKLHETKVTDKTLIGRLKTNLFRLIDGHLYFNDQIIKIRYDLFKNQKNTRDLTEYEALDYYDDILNQKQGEKVQAGFPIHVIRSRRLIYLIKNKKRLSSKNILILPYLHERRIILQNYKPDCEYFNTSLIREDEDGIQSTFLITMNITEKKFYVYSQRGLLKNRCDFSIFSKQYGKPKAVSNNGLCFIFKKKDDFDLHIVKMNHEKLEHISTIHIPTAIRNCELSESIQSIIADDFENLNDPKMVKQYFQINDNMDVVVQLISKYSEGQNQKAQQKDERRKSGKIKNIFQLKNKLTEKVKDDSPKIFYFERSPAGVQFQQSIGGASTSFKSIFRGKKNLINATCFTTQDENLAEFFKDGVDGFSINQGYIFFWNHFNIWHMSLTDETIKMSKLGLVVDPDEQQTWIKTVRTGSDWKKVAVMIRQSKTEDSSILWSIDNDNEINQFDHGLNPQIFWDRDGDAYVTEEDQVFNCQMGVALNCYDVETINEHEIRDSKKQQFGYHQGHKFDFKGHSWIFLREQISLSYCYMTFVLNKKTKDKQSYQLEDYLFDRQQYDYIIDRRTALSDEDLIRDPQKLNYILKKFEETDAGLLEQLQHYYLVDFDDDGNKLKEPRRVTPLHIAWKLQNYSINVILRYMAKLEYSQFENFKDLWHKLVDYKTFQDFLYEQTFQTLQMQNKQTIRMPYKHSDSIVCIEKAYSSYVDENYFRDMMKEDKEANHNSFPVKVVALEVGWILEQPQEGKKFLQAILQSENSALYDNYATESLIEFLFMNYKKEAFSKLPYYLFRLFVFLFTIYYHEQHLLQKQVVQGGEEETLALFENAQKHMVLLVLNAIGCIITGYQMIRLTTNSCETYWPSTQAFLDLGYFFFNTVITLGFFFELEIKIMRVCQAILSLTIWFKSMYYLQISYYFSSLITIIGQIFVDIGWFILLLIVLIFMFANAFFLLGQNQIQFDGLKVDDGEGNDEMPLYAKSLVGSLQYIFMLSLGELGVDQFEKGEGTQTPYLWILFIIASFTLIVHMLNMLIAIMGETFANSNEIDYQTKLKKKLQFVIDNWYTNALGDDMKRISYIITALYNEEDDEEVEILKEITEDFASFRQRSKSSVNKIMAELKKIKLKVAQVEKSQ